MLDLTNRRTPEELSKLPKPTNKGLAEIFSAVDYVAIKDDGVIGERALSDKVVLDISKPADIAKLLRLLEIDENNTGFYCVCLGTYAIELYSEGTLKTTIGLRHGASIRYWRWNGDAELAKSKEILSFLATLGLSEPLQERLQQEKDQEPDQVAKRKWRETAPKCLHQHAGDCRAFDDRIIQSIVSDLDREIPNRIEQIVVLLQTFGCGVNCWSGYPVYEELPGKILRAFGVQEVVAAYLQSNRNYKTRRGLGRLLLSSSSRLDRSEQARVQQVVIDDLKKCYQYFNDAVGLERIEAIFNQAHRTP